MGLVRKARRFLSNALLRETRNELSSSAHRSLMLQGFAASDIVGNKERLGHLSDASFQVSSQWGEDGIIEWIVSHLPDVSPTFIEFGVTDYTEANTRFLVQHRNWRGLVAEADPEAVARLRNDPILWRHDITVAQTFITKENINDLFVSSGFSGRIGLLSIDIDGNDYWIWEAITDVDPDIVVCEYNAVFGDLHPISVPYDEAFGRTNAHFSNLYWGASIPAMVSLAQSKGYRLVGTNLEGCNAFFVRADLADELLARIGSTIPRPSLYRDSRGENGNLTYKRSLERAAAISHLPVVRVDGGTQGAIITLGDLYSPTWRALMGA